MGKPGRIMGFNGLPLSRNRVRIRGGQIMSATRKTSGYAPGSNRDGRKQKPPVPAARLTAEERLLIQQRLRRHYLAEDARLNLDQAVTAMAPQRPRMLPDLRELLPVRLIWRPRLKQA
jgi:hypothetical protein